MPVKEASLKEETVWLKELLDQLSSTSLIADKEKVLDHLDGILSFIKKSKSLSHYVIDASTEERYAIKSIIAIGQGPIVFREVNTFSSNNPLKDLVRQLLQVEDFYQAIGGIIGYHYAVLHLIQELDNPEKEDEFSYHRPEGLDLCKSSIEVHKAIKEGIDALPFMGEIYPVGGAGDRLNLIDPLTNEPLPAALLPFGEGNLLEGLIRDLQAREFLYFKLTGKQVCTPIAMMTSNEKNNHARILEVCEKAQWFGRPKDSFRFFVQPSVPVLTIEGNWVMTEPLKMLAKPGGHGVIWREALRQGIFDWFSSLGRKKFLVRQINNPLAGTDHGLLALAGVGFQDDKAFGVASCPRYVNSAEGMLVMVEKKGAEGVSCGITNIEYTEFKKRGIEDAPTTPNGKYSLFPSNTNILFVDLQKMREKAQNAPIPGMLINMKSTVLYTDAEGEKREIKGGRLESTMQNVADFLTDSFPKPLEKGEQNKLQTFVTYNTRRKTSAFTKSLYKKGESAIGTPEGAFYERMHNAYDLLKNYCNVEVPKVQEEDEFLREGPSFIFEYHPGLGPLFEVIGQKIQGGKFEKGAELQLELSEVHIESLILDGSLIIKADSPLGKKDEKGTISYQNQGGRCLLKNIRVRNRGIDSKAENCYWSGKIARREALEVFLEGNAEFIAENVVFNGNITIKVPDGWCWTAKNEGKEVVFDKKKVESSSWKWSYDFESYQIILELK